MANTCISEYMIEAPKPTLDRLEQAVKNPQIDPGSDKRWEGNVIITLGGTINPEHYLRGFITEVKRLPAEVNYPDRLYIMAEEAWHITQFAEALKEILPDAKIYWYEDTDEGKSTNDRDQKYFEYGYLLDAYNDENEEEYYNVYPTKEELMKVLEDDFNITDIDDVMDYIGNGNGYANVYEVEVVDDGLNKASGLQESITKIPRSKNSELGLFENREELESFERELSSVRRTLNSFLNTITKEMGRTNDKKHNEGLNKIKYKISDALISIDSYYTYDDRIRYEED